MIGNLAQAAVIFDSGYVTFTPTGTQFGRISRDGIPSDWSGPKDFPGVFGAPTLRAVEVFTVNVGPFSFIQVNFDDPDAVLFISAYLNSFNPVNSAPNYGLDVNYLGDPGLTQFLGNPSFFQIEVAPFSKLVLPVNEVNPGGGTNRILNVLVEGFFDTEFNDVPEPSSMGLMSGGAALVILLARKRST